MIAGYVQSGAYSVKSMEERELEIRKQAEDLVQSTLPLHKRILYNWVLHHARKGNVAITDWNYLVWLGVKHRENLRFARTKVWGVVRHLFRAVGLNLYKLGMIKTEEVHTSILLLHTYWSSVCLVKDVFYLTVDELFEYVEGRSVTNDLMALTDLRKKEWSGYKKV